MFFKYQSYRETMIAGDDRKGLPSAWTHIGALAAAVILAASLAVPTGCSSSQQPASSASSEGSTSSAPLSSANVQQASSAEDAEDLITVNVTVNASSVKDEGWDADMIEGAFSLPRDATVYDALIATGVETVDEDGYVTSIDGLRTGQFGASSGWMYSVNDENPFTAAREYVLADGDSVRWYYSR